MNKDTVEGKKDQLIGKIKQKWAMLGNDDYKLLLEGKVQEFSGRLQSVTGKSREEAEREIKDMEKSCGCSFSDSKAA